MQEIKGVHQAILFLVVPIIVAIGTFATLQADLRHLERRLDQDEIELKQQIDHLESRIRIVELDTTGRLAGIETKLTSIETYIMEINQNIRKNLVFSIDEGGQQ